jgi:hypothetical protein
MPDTSAMRVSQELSIHWSRRGGRPPYRGQSYALAAPRLSSGVIRLHAHSFDQVKVTRIEYLGFLYVWRCSSRRS